MADLRTIYLVDSEDETRRKLWELTQRDQVRLETFTHGESFLSAFNGAQGCLITELQIADMSGLELLGQLRQQGIKLPVIFVTAHADTDLIVRAMQLGAITVLKKPVGKVEILDAVTEALARDDDRRRVDARHEKLQRRLTRLNSKDRDVLDLIMEGLANKEIAKRLNVSLRTVEARRQKIFQKTNCGSLAELMKLVIHVEWKSGE